MICCSSPKIINGDCHNCFSSNVKLVFAEYPKELSSKTMRLVNFEKYLFGVDLPYYLKYSFLDLFPKIENSFHISDRNNFINLSQLIRELLIIFDKKEYLHLFPEMKTKNRIESIKIIIDRALETSQFDLQLIEFENLELIEMKLDYEIDFSKIVIDNHIFVDKPNINAITSRKNKSSKKTHTPYKSQAKNKSNPKKQRHSLGETQIRCRKKTS